jgi:AraC family transcriptional regulator
VRPLDSDFDLYTDGKLIRPEPSQVGDIGIFGLREGIASDSRDPYHGLDLYIPQRALTALADAGDIARDTQELHQSLGRYVQDPVARHLLLAMQHP